MAATPFRSVASSTSSASPARRGSASRAADGENAFTTPAGEGIPPAMTNEGAATVVRTAVSSQELRRLVERGQQGDREALEELYLLHFDRIYSYLHMSVGNRHDAEDLTTQTFLKMLESIGRFRWQAAPFSAWLFRLAPNLAMDHFRASRRWQPEEDVPEPDPPEESAAEEEALESIGRKSMLELIESLSLEQQQVLTLKFVFNFSNAEAATVLGKTEGAIKSLQHRALVSLQKQLERREKTLTDD